MKKLNINLSDLRNRAITTTIKVLDKAKAPPQYETLFQKACALNHSDLIILSANIRREINNRESARPVCYQCDKEVAYLFDDARCKDCTRLTREEIEGDVPCSS